MMSEFTAEELRDLDQQYVWHPYAATGDSSNIFPVVSAEGVRLHLADGRSLIDGMSSWWSTIHGYNHPALNDAAEAQIQKMSHVMFGGLTHPAAVTLCETLVNITPQDLDKVFLSDSGSVAMEVAVKMAIQYWQSQDKPEKHKMLALRSGYHGDTLGTMALCDPVTGMHHLFSKVLKKNLFAAQPRSRFGEPCEEEDIASIKALLAENHQQIAAFVLEPIVQGAGGMWFYSADYLKAVRQLCNQYDVLLIADEIATGFGRTGLLFACEHADISPDILCVGKALTGGYLSLAATLCSDSIAKTICAGEAGVFMHGPTFMANPLACAIANRSLELLLKSDWQTNIAQLQQHLEQGLKPAETLATVQEVRCLGAIGVIEMIEPVDMKTIQPAFVEAGVWVRPFGKLVYIMPAYNMSYDDLSFLCRAIIGVLSEQASKA